MSFEQALHDLNDHKPERIAGGCVRCDSAIVREAELIEVNPG